MGRQAVRVGQAGACAQQVAPLHHHHAEVVQALHVVGLDGQDLAVAGLGRFQVPQVVDVDISEENETLGVVGMVADQLVEEGGRLQRPVRVREEEGQVEEGAAKVQLELDGPAEPELGGGQVAAVHGEHAEVEVDPLVDLTLAYDLVQPVHGQLAEVAAPALLDQHR